MTPRALVAACLTVVLAASAFGGRAADAKRACTTTATTLRGACALDAGEAAATTLAACINLEDEDARDDCRAEAKASVGEARADCADVFAARKEVCESVGEARYDPAFGEAFADRFVDPRDIGDSVQPNPFFPLIPGATREFRGTFTNEEGETVTETETVTYSDGVKSIEGVLCLRVRDVVEEDGEVVEDTEDWFAQDVDGNVWYCGEIAQSFETFEGDDPDERELVDVEGSWKAGRDLAKPGLAMPANPQVGTVIRQELAWAIAEDVIEIADLQGSATVPAAACNGTCLITHDFSALEPGVTESKYYARGIGLILELGAGGERLELVAHDE